MTQPTYLKPGTRDGTVMALAVMGGLSFTIISESILPLLPKVDEAVHASAATGAWLATAFALCGVITVPLVARWCDMAGPRGPMLFCLGAFLAGTLICLFGDNMPVFILGRTVTGAGAGMFPVAMGLVRAGVRTDRIRMGISLVAGTLGLGVGIGAILAGIVLEFPGTSYKTVFLISALIAAAGLLACFFLVPPTDPAEKSRRSLDLPGAILLGGGLTCAVLVLSNGPSWGWGSAASVGLIVGALVLLAACAVYEMRSAPDPLVDIRLFLAPLLGLTLLVQMATGFASVGVNLGLSAVVQLPKALGPLPFYGLGSSVLIAGLILIPIGGGNFAVAPVTAILSKRIGLTPTLIAGTWLILAGYLFVQAEHSSLWAAFLTSVLVGIGTGLNYTTSANVWVTVIPRERLSVSYAVVANFISIGSLLGVALYSSFAASRPFKLPPGLHLQLPALSAYTALWWACAIAAGIAAGCAIGAALCAPGFGKSGVQYTRDGWRMRRELPIRQRLEVPASGAVPDAAPPAL